MNSNKVLIIGNGFDLDLGLKTSYSSFIESEYFQNIADKYELTRFLQNNYLEKRWIDIEEDLKVFAERHGRESRLMNESKDAFIQLTNSLCDYLDNIDYSIINTESVAADLLRSVAHNGYFRILDYNYTSLNKICSILSIHNKINCTYVHGNLGDRSIILGFQDDVEVHKSAYFMIKSHNEHYTSCNVRNLLDNADEIVFFGHSLGSTDYHYFSDFFQKQSELTASVVQSKKIRFFTYNEISRQALLAQLREMNEKRVNYLYDLNDLQFYRTDNKNDLRAINRYLQELRESSIEVYQEKMRNITSMLY